jgi:hypothetical protein
LKNDFEVKIKTNSLFENQDFIDKSVKSIFQFPECKIIMDEFIVSGYKRVVYEVKNPKEEIKIVKEKLEKKLKEKIKDVEIEIRNLDINNNK